MLGAEDLVDRSISELGQILLAAGRRHDPDPEHDFRVRLHSDGSRDLRVLVDSGTATLAWAWAWDDTPTNPRSRSTPQHATSSFGADDPIDVDTSAATCRILTSPGSKPYSPATDIGHRQRSESDALSANLASVRTPTRLCRRRRWRASDR